MATDITLDATESGADSNSYISLDDADTWFSIRYGYDDWFSIDTFDKKRLLTQATREIDTLRCLYSSYDTDQALQYPISNDSSESAAFDCAQNACCYQAWHIYKNTDSINEAKRDRLSGLKNKHYGSSSFQFAGLNQLDKIASEVYRELSDYLNLTITLSRA